MKSRLLKQKARAPKANAKQPFSFSEALRSARQTSAYLFVASLGIWLPRAQAATLISLDAATHPLGPLNIWTNTGSVTGDFIPPGSAVAPTNKVVDGVNGVEFI